MKFKIVFILFSLLSVNSWSQIAAPHCELIQKEGVQKHFKCYHPDSQQYFHLLDITGNFNKVSFYHGKFLAHEIENTILKGIKEAENRAFNDLEPSERKTLLGLRDCVIGRQEQGSSFDFQDGLSHLVKGMRDGGSQASKADIKDAHYLVEFSIFTDALKRNMEENPKKMKREILLNCGPQMVVSKITSSIGSFFRSLRKLKMGCTGIVSNSLATTDGSLLHARNFDTGLLGFVEKEPLVQIQRLPEGRYVVGLATAGMPYAGGVSGFNSDGLSGSLHELQTREVRIFAERYTTDIAPYLLHKVLTEARTLDQAIDLIKTVKGYGAWTFLIADAKTNEVASIEMSGTRVVVARRSVNQNMAQSNHFLADLTREVGFEYSANKTLESVSRFNFVNRELTQDSGTINEQWMINHLSGHWDEFQGLRSFGRTTTKVYTALSHVMNAKNQSWWMTLADRYPTNRSAFVGMKLQLDQPVPISFIGSTKAEESLAAPEWYESLQYFVKAWMNLEQSSRKDLSASELALQNLESAQGLASLAGVQEYAYHFMWARIQIHKAALQMAQGNNLEAFNSLNRAEEKLLYVGQFENLHDFEKGQIIFWQTRIQDLRRQMGQSTETDLSLLNQGKEIFFGLYKDYPFQNLFEKLGNELGQSIPYTQIISESPELVTVE